jgi:uncharacterized protein
LIVLDATVLLYAVGVGHPLREPSRRLVRAIGEGAVAATTSVAVIQEFAHVRARRRGRSDARGRAAEFAEVLAPLLPIAPTDVAPALRLFERHAALDAFDAFLAAAALAHRAEALVSADRAFKDVRGLSFVELGSSRLDALLG